MLSIESKQEVKTITENIISYLWNFNKINWVWPITDFNENLLTKF